MLRADPFAFLFGAFLLLTLPLSWLSAACLSAAMHELCHLAALSLLGGRVRGIHIGAGGTVIDTEELMPAKELICALAGPMGSLFLLSLNHVFPKLAICAGVQGLFNLLPVYPLDGGRILRCILELCHIRSPERILAGVEEILMFLWVLLCIAGTWFLSLGPVPWILPLLLILKLRSGKRPCKRIRNRVQ